MAHIIRHDVQKMMKELANEENRREIVSKFRLQSWYMMIVLTNIGQTVKIALEKQREIRQKQQRMTFLLKKFLYKIKSSLLKKAPNKGIRSTIDLRLYKKLFLFIYPLKGTSISFQHHQTQSRERCRGHNWSIYASIERSTFDTE